MKIIRIIGLFALIASVATHAQVDATLQLRGKSYPKLNEKECLAKGGRWGVLGIPGSPYPPECNLRTTDSEKKCGKPEDCEGYCMADPSVAGTKVGKCSDSQEQVGCREYIQDGKAIGVCN